jgi:2,5-diamino-6-(ribosylamino)-4(3H)-pyrimidinone 5'-phosphate reductase
MNLHYQLAGKYSADAHLIGSNTVKMGIVQFGEGVPAEEAKDFQKPKSAEHLPYWVIVDTKGSARGLLHVCRRFEFCRDVIVLISEGTPKEYVEYLKERNYDFHFVGKARVNLKKAFELLASKYGVKTVVTDTGRILGNLLLNQALVSEISLLVHPVIVGNKAYSMFTDVKRLVRLRLRKKQTFGDGYVWLVYEVIN